MTEPKLSTAARIILVMSEIGDIPKDGWNSAQNYAFRRAEDVTVRVRDVMSAHGLGLIPISSELLHDETRDKGNGKIAREVVIRMTYAFFSADDPTDRIEIQIIGEGADSLDKASTKALTAAFKYALLQSFAIGEDADDGDASSGAEISTTKTEPPPSNAATPEQIEEARSALSDANLNQIDLDVIRRWCIAAEFGSISKGHVDSRLLPAFHALVGTLSGSTSEEAVK